MHGHGSGIMTSPATVAAQLSILGGRRGKLPIDHLHNDVKWHFRTSFPTTPGSDSMCKSRCVGCFVG